MPLLDGTIDKVLKEEAKNMDQYLKGSIELKIVPEKKLLRWEEELTKE